MPDREAIEYLLEAFSDERPAPKRHWLVDDTAPDDLPFTEPNEKASKEDDLEV